ncbi:MAG: hypothetical protein ACI4S2_10125 [Lachnospiraceae bacterium]
MNDSEKRRKQLLEETRARYSDYREPPAVHPRYRNSYNRLYREDAEEEYSTFGIRAFLCLLLFVAFVTMDIKKQEILHVDTQRIVQEITTDLDVAEVWKNL